MQLVTITFILKKNKVLLGVKKKGFGAGNWNGYGGKVRSSERSTIESTAIREIREECRLRVRKNSLNKVAVVKFYFNKKLFFKCFVFIVTEFEGEPKETKEMGPHKWFSLEKLPQKMWPGDRLWLPLIFSGKKIRAAVNFNTDGSKVKNFSWEEAKFD